MPNGVGVEQNAFRVRDVSVEPDTGLLIGPAGRVRLEPKVMAVLAALAARPGELLSRQELLAAIWPGGDVYDDALTQAVYQLRQQLANVGGVDTRDFVKTVPKRGYVLTAPVERAKPREAIPVEPKRRWTPERAGLAVWGLAIACAALAAVLYTAWSSRGEPAAAPVRVAVLPFLPLLAQQRDPALEHGLADTLITLLSADGAFAVRPISSVRHFDNLDRDTLEVAKALGVDAVVDGHLQHVDDALRINVRLLRVTDGVALWAETFEKPYADIFSLQDDIGAHIASALAPRLAGTPLPMGRRGGTANLEAYESYLQGRFHLARLTPDDLRKSLGYFRAAVAADPVYLQAWLGLANASFRLPIAGEAPAREHFAEARAAADRALELDPDSAEAHSYLGWIEHWHGWDWEASEAHFRRALQLDPSDTEAHLGLATLLSDVGRNEEALVEARRGRELSPFYMAAAALESNFLLREGFVDEAQRRMEDAVAIDPQFWLTRVSLAGCYERQGRADDALAQLRVARELTGGSTWATALAIGVLARNGRRAEAEALLGELLERSRSRFVPPYDFATAYQGLGDPDAALSWLEQAWEMRDPKLAFLGTSQRAWAPLDERPEFLALVRRMNFPGGPP